MEVNQEYLQNMLKEIKESGSDTVTYEELEAKLEKTDITPEQNAELYKYLENNGVKSSIRSKRTIARCTNPSATWRWTIR